MERTGTIESSNRPKEVVVDLEGKDGSRKSPKLERSQTEMIEGAQKKKKKKKKKKRRRDDEFPKTKSNFIRLSQMTV